MHKNINLRQNKVYKIHLQFANVLTIDAKFYS